MATNVSSSSSSGNYLMAVMQAISNCVASGSGQQLADANTAMGCIDIQQKVSKDWLAKFKDATDEVTEWSNKIAAHPDDPKVQEWKNKLTAAQAKLGNVQTQMETFKNQASALVDSAQAQTGQDSVTMQQRLQLMSAVTQIAQSLASILGKG